MKHPLLVLVIAALSSLFVSAPKCEAMKSAGKVVEFHTFAISDADANDPRGATVTFLTASGRRLHFVFPPNSRDLLYKLFQPCPESEGAIVAEYDEHAGNSDLLSVECIPWSRLVKPPPDDPFWAAKAVTNGPVSSPGDTASGPDGPAGNNAFEVLIQFAGPSAGPAASPTGGTASGQGDTDDSLIHRLIVEFDPDTKLPVFRLNGEVHTATVIRPEDESPKSTGIDYRTWYQFRQTKDNGGPGILGWSQRPIVDVGPYSIPTVPTNYSIESRQGNQGTWRPFAIITVAPTPLSRTITTYNTFDHVDDANRVNDGGSPSSPSSPAEQPEGTSR